MPELFVADKNNQAQPASTWKASQPSNALYRKAAPPRMGEQFGPSWSDPNSASMQLPGGGIMVFDLEKLTLQDFRAMRNHYQINISLSLLSFMIHQVDWRIECEDPVIKEFVDQNLHEVWTRLIRAISPAFWSGYAPIVVQYENDGRMGKIVANKFKDIAPENARVNWKEVDGYAPQGSIPPKLRVFDGIKVDGQTHPVPPENSLWYPLLMESGDYYGRKMLKPAFPSWFFSQIIHLYANRYFERFGEPTPIGRAPFDEEVDQGDGSTKSGREVMIDVLAGLKNRGSVVLPSDRAPGAVGDSSDFEYQIHYLESQMRGADFERYLTRLDEEMSLGIFTPVLLYRTADVGSYNLGEAHFQIFLVMVNSLVADLGEYINRYLIDRLVDFNFSPKAPRARFAPRKHGKEVQATLRQIMMAMVQSERATVDVEDLGEALGMKVHEIVQMTDPETGKSEPGQREDDGGRSPANLSRVMDSMVGRIEGQVRKNWDELEDAKLHPGYSRRFESALMEEGYEEHQAKSITSSLYGRLGQFLDETTGLGSDAYPGGADEFIRNFQKLVDTEVETI